MNPRKSYLITKVVILLVVFVSLGLLWGNRSDGCTTIMVGKDASVDGSVMIAYTMDWTESFATSRYVPAADHEPDSIRLEKNFRGKLYQVPGVEHTYAYFDIEFPVINEYQVAMSAEAINPRAELAHTPAVFGDSSEIPYLGEFGEFMRIAMERSKTAKEAVELIGSFAEKYGLNVGVMFSIADPNEVWHLEMTGVGPIWFGRGEPGAIWCAQRIPDDEIGLNTNEYWMKEIHPDDPDNFMCSSNVISFAVEHGWYDLESGEPFNFMKAYAPSSYSARSSGGLHARPWRILDLVAPSLGLSVNTPNIELPFSVKPDNKLGVEDLLAILRDYYEGTEFYLTGGVAAGPFANPNRCRPLIWGVGENVYNWPRPIATVHMDHMRIVQLRDWLPDPIGGVAWIGLGVADTACLMPFYSGITQLPERFTVGDLYDFSRDSARWAFDYVNSIVQLKYSYAIKDVEEAQSKWEKGALDRQGSIEQQTYHLYAQDPSNAIEFLNDYCTGNANDTIDAWWDLGDYLLTKYNHGNIYDVEERKCLEAGYPEAWLKEVEEDILEAE